MDEPFLGMIIPWPIGFAPMGWMFCSGQSLNVSQYSALFSLLGYTYGGSGNTFNLPDLRGRMIIGAGMRNGSTINYQMGAAGGNELTTATMANLPNHNHQAVNYVTGGGNVPFTISAKNKEASTNIPSDTAYLAKANDGVGKEIKVYNADAAYIPDVNIAGGTVTIPQPTVTTTIGYTGSGDAMTTVSPYLAMNYIIAMEGLYPTHP
jgi:microcystin-dependent protein